jgi:hypothetical protein
MKLSVQKTFRAATVLSLFAVGLLLNNVAMAQQKFILSTTEFTVKSGHASQFEEGVKAWKACYLENKGEWTWNMWKRYNGKGSVYVLSSMSPKWAEFDDDNDEAGKKCRQIVLDKIVPHIESSEDNFATSIPEFSRTGTSEMGIIWVTFFSVENGPLFREIVKETTEIIQKAEGDSRWFWYVSNGGSPEGADFFVTTPFKNFAALDVERDGVWKMVENSKGKEHTDKLRASFRSTLENSWAYMYKRMEALSHNPVQ